ncbi:hypothetical protein [Nocardioides sp. LML1-1-1.1]|uniref:hypothetical protein n=1 Tax=Nocardioides sp. LML1-1-1.1 TaxID=3135248 RepID=UPI0034277FF1
MAGQNIAELQQWTAGMNENDVATSQMAWFNVAGVLQTVSTALKGVAPALKEGFGDSDIAETAPVAFTNAADKLEEQRPPMLKASKALDEVQTAMKNATATSGTKVDEPGPAPQQENYPGIPIVADLKFAADTAKHVADVAAYNAHDAQAGERLAALKKSYTAAVTVFKEIHGDPYIPVDPDDSTGGNGPTGRRPSPGGGVKPVRPIGTIIGDDDDPGKDDDRPDRPDPVDPPLPPRPPIDNGVDENWPTFDPDPTDPVGPYPGGPNAGGGGGGGGGISPGLIGGGLAAGGALAAPGAIKGLSGMLSRAGLSGGGTIGASSRAGGPGALGRSGAGTPGSPTSRGAGGRGAGGRAGAPGAQGGRGRGGAGGRGGRGAAGAGGGRGRGKKDQENGADQELYDDGQDWLDDEGAGPSVLG